MNFIARIMHLNDTLRQAEEKLSSLDLPTLSSTWKVTQLAIPLINDNAGEIVERLTSVFEAVHQRLADEVDNFVIRAGDHARYEACRRYQTWLAERRYENRQL